MVMLKSVHKNISKTPRYYLINNMLHNVTKSKYVSHDVWHTVVVSIMDRLETYKGMRHMLNHIKSFVPWI